MKKISCKACSPEADSCYRCGGYKYLIEQKNCKCGREYWVRPGSYTAYEGRKFRSFDGLEMTCHIDGPNSCEHCGG